MALITRMGSINLLLFSHRGSNSTKAMKFDEVVTIPMNIISLCSFYLQTKDEEQFFSGAFQSASCILPLCEQQFGNYLKILI